MRKRHAICILGSALLAMLSASEARAGATLASASVNCSQFTATGTVTTPYVAVRVWNSTAGQTEGGPAIIDSYVNVGAPTAYFAAPSGTFSFTVNFPKQPTGNVIIGRVYGAITPTFGSWDGGTFPQIQGACADVAVLDVPALSGWKLAVVVLLLGAAGVRMAYRS